MDLKDIKSLIEMMKRYDLAEFEIEEEGLKLRLSRNQAGQPMLQTSHAYPLPHGEQVIYPPVRGVAEDEGKEDDADAADFAYVKSPMVGTFYRSPSPDSAPFVSIGDQVSDDTVVCIVEAMKVMNEIQAEVRGEIAEVLVENGVSVEYGQPLFKLRQSR